MRKADNDPITPECFLAAKKWLRAPVADPEFMKRADDFLIRFESQHRAYGLFVVLTGAVIARRGDLFWQILAEWWSSCDDTWPYRRDLLSILLSAPSPAPSFPGSAPLRVYRGCSRPRVRGISWTLDRDVASAFARGHRGIRIPDPVIATAQVKPEHVFFFTNERKEQEIVLHPRHLCRLTTIPYVEEMQGIEITAAA